MIRHCIRSGGVCLLLTVAAATTTMGQIGQRTPAQLRAAYEAHEGDFDYLLGDWSFTGVRDNRPLHGFWSAVRVAEGAQILDEYRVVDDSGKTFWVSSTLRAYNVFADQWELISVASGGGLKDFGTARREGDEMHIQQSFGVAAGYSSIWRIRYFDIKGDRFSWVADRSVDGGKTWTKDFQRLEVRRLGPARSLGPLAPARDEAGVVARE
jgi:hypothetical protein